MEPFGENVEGLSHCGNKSHVERAVEEHALEGAALRGVIGGKPLIPKGLREFKNFRGQLGGFVIGHRYVKRPRLGMMFTLAQAGQRRWRRLNGHHQIVHLPARKTVNNGTLQDAA